MTVAFDIKEETVMQRTVLVQRIRGNVVLSSNPIILTDEMAQKKLLELTQKIYLASQSIAKLESTREQAVMDRKCSERKIAACERELASIQVSSKTL